MKDFMDDCWWLLQAILYLVIIVSAVILIPALIAEVARAEPLHKHPMPSMGACAEYVDKYHKRRWALLMFDSPDVFVWQQHPHVKGDGLVYVCSKDEDGRVYFKVGG